MTFFEQCSDVLLMHAVLFVPDFRLFLYLVVLLSLLVETTSIVYTSRADFLPSWRLLTQSQ